MKIYYGALYRYRGNLFEDDFVQVDNTLIIVKQNTWSETIGSYKLIDNEDGTYNSYMVDRNGNETPLKVNKPFNAKDLQSEIDKGFLVITTESEGG